MAPPTGPFWSVEAEQHYWYDEDHDLIIYQDGSRVQRPPNVPRSMLMTPATPTTTRSQRNTSAGDYQDLGSPPGSGGAYVTTRANPVAEDISHLTSRFNAFAVGASNEPGTRTTLRHNIPSSSQQEMQSGSSNPMPTRTIVGDNGVTTTLSGLPEEEIVSAFNPSNLVQTLYRTGPRDSITDPELLRDGRGKGAYRMLLETGSQGDTEQLFATFQVVKDPINFFKVGKVFMVLWAEPAGGPRTIVSGQFLARAPGIAQGRYGEIVHSKMRKFVVIREGNTYCSALPIATYGNQGVGRPNVNKSEHAIIYTGREAPEAMRSEEPTRGEHGMRPASIRVEQEDREEKLDPRSRVDFGKVYTIQHNIKVKSYGKVHDRFLHFLTQQFTNCWHAPSVPTVSPATTRATNQGSSKIPADTRASARTSAPVGSKGGSSEGRSQPRRGSPSGSSQVERRNVPRASTTSRQTDERETTTSPEQMRRAQILRMIEQYMAKYRCSREQATAAVYAHVRQQRRDNDDDEDEEEEEEDEEDDD